MSINAWMRARSFSARALQCARLEGAHFWCAHARATQAQAMIKLHLNEQPQRLGCFFREISRVRNGGRKNIFVTIKRSMPVDFRDWIITEFGSHLITFDHALGAATFYYSSSRGTRVKPSLSAASLDFDFFFGYIRAREEMGEEWSFPGVHQCAMAKSQDRLVCDPVCVACQTLVRKGEQCGVYLL